jgi:hypothetical protein
MTNVEHLLENGLMAVDKAFEKGEDCYIEFEKEMQYPVNQDQLEMVSVTKDELWEIVQYIKFVREMG